MSNFSYRTIDSWISHVFEPPRRGRIKKTKDQEEKLFPRNGNHFSSLTPLLGRQKRGETPTRSLAEIIRHYLRRDGILEKDLFRILNRRLQPRETNDPRVWVRWKNAQSKKVRFCRSFWIFVGRFNCVWEQKVAERCEVSNRKRVPCNIETLGFFLGTQVTKVSFDWFAFNIIHLKWRFYLLFIHDIIALFCVLILKFFPKRW